ncbi:hypothetical protein GYMLUDRAFT_242376 [Collybiopsis luxurians FD-317 M1]|uniref:Uncharacterized protein n=1 Tax=Collybiopsis luxurians FD-317 M1 TaxID=944289 RepID=A0A0D0C3L8_9AGAR|nr:hypothetical protein GYMLUDRAFT_242376 [Collybiopsis luxurians FD-317 M1]
MTFRAYELQNDVSVNSSRPVTIEELSALGVKIVTFDESQDSEQAAQRLVQEQWGYPLDKKDSVVPFDLRQNAANTPEISGLVAQLVQLIENPVLAFSVDLTGIVSYSTIYLDVEDIKSKKWIRIHPGPRQLYRVAAGLKIRAALTDQNRDHAGILFFKDGVSSLEIIPEKDLDNHAARQSYLNSIGKF